MSSFTTPLVVEANPDSKGWTLYKSFTYHIGSEFSRNYITVPRGFVTDFASIPNPLRGLIPQWGRYGKAAVVHDYLYHWWVRDSDNNFSPVMSRLEADNIFLEAMVVLEVPKWQRTIMWLAVRTFGGLAWGNGTLFISHQPVEIKP